MRRGFFTDGLEAPSRAPIVDDAANAARHEHDRQHDDHAEDHHPIDVEILRFVHDDGHAYGADHAAPDVAETTEYDHQQQRDHFLKLIVIRMDVTRSEVCFEAAGSAGVDSREHEGDDLVLGDVEAAGRRG